MSRREMTARDMGRPVCARSRRPSALQEAAMPRSCAHLRLRRAPCSATRLVTAAAPPWTHIAWFCGGRTDRQIDRQVRMAPPRFNPRRRVAAEKRAVEVDPARTRRQAPNMCPRCGEERDAGGVDQAASRPWARSTAPSTACHVFRRDVKRMIDARAACEVGGDSDAAPRASPPRRRPADRSRSAGDEHDLVGETRHIASVEARWRRGRARGPRRGCAAVADAAAPPARAARESAPRRGRRVLR